MRNHRGVVEEERSHLYVVAHELQHRVGDPLRRILGARHAAGVALERLPLALVHEKTRVEIVRVALAIVAVEAVEALRQRDRRSSRARPGPICRNIPVA
ncbi:MAG: hypothetical protein ACOX5J_08665 [Candidatus Hydrogenedentales bacterium]